MPLTYGLVPLLAGLDKFFNLLADWPKYVSPPIRRQWAYRVWRGSAATAGC